MQKKLTTTQKEAIDTDGKVILKACPGSGKTFVVANKIVKETKEWKLKNSGIALLSFTNVASEEIEKTINEITDGYKIGYPHHLGTIDSFISQFIFMPFGSLVMGCQNVRPSIIQDYCVNIHAYIDRIWRKECYDYGCRPLDFYYDMNENLCCLNKDISSCLVKKNKPCITLKKYCYKNGYASYADMTYITLKVLKGYPDIAKMFCRRFSKIIVDEAQDTSREQMAIFETLCETGLTEIMLIGDPDQAIYEWRDADPSVFIKKYQDVEWNSRLFNENFRCSQNICNATKIFSSLPQISVAKGSSANCAFKPQIIKYDSNNQRPLIEHFLTACTLEGITINEDNVVILVRGKTGLLGKDYSQINDLWQSYLAKIISEACFEKGNKKIKRAMELVEKALYYLYIDKAPGTIIDEILIKEKMSLEIWDHIVLEFCKRIPESTLSLSQWKANSVVLLNEITKKYTYSIVGDTEIKIKTRVKDGNLKDFLQQPLRDFFSKSYNLRYLNTTIHQVKGRTFDAVLLIIAQHGKLTSNMINTKPIDSEPIRTAYVAMTRARKILMVAIPKSIKDNTLVRFPTNDWDCITI